jgi:cation transporter-like permease
MTTENTQRGELRAAAIFGLIIAIVIDIGWLFTLFPYMSPNTWRWPIAVLTCVIQTIVTTDGIVLAARLHRRLRVNAWFAIPYGAVAGALVGAVSLSLAIGVRTLLGMRDGAGGCVP